MKVLMPLVVLLSLCSFSNAQEKDLDFYISKNKKSQFKYDAQKIQEDSLQLRDSWISPIMLNYNYSVSNPNVDEQTTQNASIRVNQPVFASGGIYYGIKYANASKIYSNLSLELSKRALTKETLSILIQIKQTTLLVEKQKLLIKNADINLAQIKEQYINGQLDSGFLDNAMIERNSVIQALYDIETTKEKLISKFKSLSDLDCEKVDLPKLKVLTKDEFLQNNLSLKMSRSEIEKNKYNKNVVRAKYLPSINLTAGYNWNKVGSEGTVLDSESDYYDYGFSVSIPLNINTFRDIESAKIDYLKSKVVEVDKKREIVSIFEQVMQNLKNYDKKMALALDNIDIYNRILDDTKILYKAGEKTKYDVELLQNSVSIQQIDYDRFGLDKQLELLTLYEMYKK